MWLATFALACGPLGWSVVLTHNALVLHSPDHTASLFIHLSPPILAWSFRWFHEAVRRDWGSRFSAALLVDDENLRVGNMMSLAAVAYAVWWVPYTIWLLVAGLHHSPKTTGQDTIWAYNLRKNAAFAKLVGVSVDNRLDPYQPKAALKYMCGHFVICMVMILGSFLMWHSFALHSTFCIAMFLVSAWNGANRYEKMTTRWYEKGLEDLLQEAETGKKKKKDQ